MAAEKAATADDCSLTLTVFASTPKRHRSDWISWAQAATVTATDTSDGTESTDGYEGTGLSLTMLVSLEKFMEVCAVNTESELQYCMRHSITQLLTSRTPIAPDNLTYLRAAA